MVDRFFNLFGMIVILAIIATVLVHATGAAQILNAWGSTFSSSVTAAQHG